MEKEILKYTNLVDSVEYNEDIEFIELFYYDGMKLGVNIEKKFILIWNDEFDDYETWFLIKTDILNLNKYLKNEISLYEVINNSKVELIHRIYKTYDYLTVIDRIYQIDEDNIPTKDSFLGFDICTILRTNDNVEFIQ